MSESYRESDRPIRYICIVCYLTVSPIDGVCGNCGGSPLQLIEGNAEIVAELRRRAQEKKSRPGRREFAFVSIGSLVLAVGLHAVLLGFRVYDVNPRRAGGWGRHTAGGEILLFVFLTFLALYVLLSYVTQWLGLFPTPESDSFDPETASVVALLSWLRLGANQKG